MTLIHKDWMYLGVSPSKLRKALKKWPCHPHKALEASCKRMLAYVRGGM